MAYTFDEFCADCRETLIAMPNKEGRKTLMGFLEQLLENKDFIAEHLGPDATPGRPIIFQDADTDFCIQIHNHGRTGGGTPHDHGSSWAIYGQAVGYTDMTSYHRLDDGHTEGHAEIEIAREFRMNPGDVGLFDVGEVHSIRFEDGCRVVRITGTDLDKLGQNVYDMEKKEVRAGTPVR